MDMFKYKQIGKTDHFLRPSPPRPLVLLRLVQQQRELVLVLLMEPFFVFIDSAVLVTITSFILGAFFCLGLALAFFVNGIWTSYGIYIAALASFHQTEYTLAACFNSKHAGYQC